MLPHSQWIIEMLTLEEEIQQALIESVIIIVVLWVIDLLLVRMINNWIEEPRRRYAWRKKLAYFLVILGLFLIVPIWLSDIQSAATFFGLVSAGIAISLQKPLGNLAGWMFIVVQQPFEVGDRIEVEQHRGDVIDIRFFQFTLLEIGNWVAADQSTGRVLHIPNAVVFTSTLANFSKGFDYIWNELEVHVTFESDWQKAKRILQEIANQHAAPMSADAAEHVRRASSRYLIVYSKLTPIVYTRVEQNGVLLTIRYLCPPRRRRSSEQTIWENILLSFAEHEDIEFAYPTQRYFLRQPGDKPNIKPFSNPGYHNEY